MEIVKHDGNEFWVKKEYPYPLPGDRLLMFVFEDELYDFMKINGIEPIPDTDLNIHSNEGSFENVKIQACFFGRYKTEDEKYADCAEYMINNL